MTSLVAAAAFASAWILTACEPAGADSIHTAAAAASAPASRTSVSAARHGAQAKALSGEISSIEPIKQVSEPAGAGDDKVDKGSSKKIIGYRIHVRLDNGGSRSFEQHELNGLDVGARVRVDGDHLRGA